MNLINKSKTINDLQDPAVTSQGAERALRSFTMRFRIFLGIALAALTAVIVIFTGIL